MSDILKCPFCNKPLQPTLRQSDEYWCENYDCPKTNIKWVGSQELWQELIRTRKALDVAVDALKWIAYDENGEQDGLEEFAISQMMEKADDAIKAITAPEQKDNGGNK